MILTGPAILSAVRAGDIEIEPFSNEQLNPASYDLRLGKQVLLYEDAAIMDSKKEHRTRRLTIDDDGFVLHPDTLYLMHTEERIFTGNYVPVIDGKSSIGRLGISIHQTAGYGDPGFDGQYTLEVTSLHYVRLYAGMRIAQIRFHALLGGVVQYDGNYKESTAMGPVASRSWRQFR